MKKFYLLLAGALMCMSAQARELTFYLGDQAITPGTTVTFNNPQVTDHGDYFEVKMAPDLYLSTNLFSNTIEITADCTSGEQIQICAGGSCQMGESVTKKNVTINTNQKLDLEFHYSGEFDAGEAIPTVTTKFDAYDGESEESRTSFTLVMGPTTGLTIIRDSAELTFDGHQLVYNISGSSELVIADTDGRSVINTTVSGEGSLSTEGLAEGIYIYRLGNKSGKIYIR